MIYVIDDNIDFLKMITKSFDNVKTFTKPEEALKSLVKDKPRVVVSDMYIPEYKEENYNHAQGMSGSELMLTIRGLVPNIPLVSISGSSLDEILNDHPDFQDLLDSGVRFFPKPLNDDFDEYIELIVEGGRPKLAVVCVPEKINNLLKESLAEKFEIVYYDSSISALSKVIKDGCVCVVIDNDVKGMSGTSFANILDSIVGKDKIKVAILSDDESINEKINMFDYSRIEEISDFIVRDIDRLNVVFSRIDFNDDIKERVDKFELLSALVRDFRELIIEESIIDFESSPEYWRWNEQRSLYYQMKKSIEECQKVLNIDHIQMKSIWNDCGGDPYETMVKKPHILFKDFFTYEEKGKTISFPESREVSFLVGNKVTLKEVKIDLNEDLNLYQVFFDGKVYTPKEFEGVDLSALKGQDRINYMLKIQHPVEAIEYMHSGEKTRRIKIQSSRSVKLLVESSTEKDRFSHLKKIRREKP